MDSKRLLRLLSADLLQLGRRRWATDGTEEVRLLEQAKNLLQLGRRRWATDGFGQRAFFRKKLPRFNWAVAVGRRMVEVIPEKLRSYFFASIGPSPLGDGWGYLVEGTGQRL